MRIAGLPIRGVAQEVTIIDYLAGEVRSYQLFELEVGTTAGPPPLVKGPVLSMPLPERSKEPGA